jgi:hypothetical protein
MLVEIVEEVELAINEAINAMVEMDYNSFILFIGRADVIPLLKESTGSECVIDYQLDRYYDETREAFYIRYLNRNYKREGFNYSGESGIDDLSIEMMIYTHLWDSMYFLKSIYRIAQALSGKGYAWNPQIPENGKYSFMKNEVIAPLVEKGYMIGDILQKGYKSSIRNAFAHSLYTVDKEKREISLRPTSSPHEILTFEEFQKCFLYSTLLMNRLQNSLEMSHMEAAKTNSALTKPFLTPDGIKVQVLAETFEIEGKEYPRFRIVIIKD